jgi:uncharacterized protein YdhG (YjbR/CyaY superfamily)
MSEARGKPTNRPPPAKTVDAYLAALPEEARATLEAVRKTIKATVPDATEGISYQMPAFRYRGRVLVWFAAFKDHCSFFPGGAAIETFKDDLKGYATSKGTIRFPIGVPLPEALVTKIVKARMAENEARARPA